MVNLEEEASLSLVGQCVRVPPVLELPLYTSPTSNANARGALGAFIARLSFLVLDSQWSGGLLHSTGRS